MAKDDNKTRPIIIKKKKYTQSHHHGGSWKIAYSDFITSMMAFFLLLWLVGSTTDEQKRGIANYFLGIDTSEEKSSGEFKSILEETQFNASSRLNPLRTSLQESKQESMGEEQLPIDDPHITEAYEPIDHEQAILHSGFLQKRSAIVDGPKEEQHLPDQGNLLSQKGTDMGNQKEASTLRFLSTQDSRIKGLTISDAPYSLSGTSEEEVNQVYEEDRKAFASIEKRLLEEVLDTEEFKALKENVKIEYLADGLRIQIIDQDKYSMFPSGSTEMYDYGKKLLAKIADIIAPTPNKLSLTGHTDLTPYKKGARYTNWELSADRANYSRYILTSQGIKEDRIVAVSGQHGFYPLIKDDFFAPQNRRISIMLYYRTLP